MHAVLYERFGERPEVATVDDPACASDGVVIAVAATGLCRSDWHGWVGHDPDIRLPHVPGHEFAGTIVSVGRDVTSWHVGDRVTTPFVCACGTCATCLRGDHQVCERQFQPGFTHWGSFAELVAIGRAETNLVRVPDDLDLDTAASLGCRFSTAYRGVVQLGGPLDGRWVAVHGCGGVGLSAVMIAVAHGARVVAVDLARASLDLAASLGAEHLVDGTDDVAATIVEVTGGGADLSIDALGSRTILDTSLRSLRRGGRHIQIGLIPGGALDGPDVPMGLVIGSELQVFGSHGMAAHTYPPMMEQIASGMLRPDLLIRDRITLDEVPARLAALGEAGRGAGGMTIIRPA